uniref:hypothetical protein n=1 Tax=Polaribacter sp. TaxID=1920175 RepID=UPI0040481646
MSKKSSMESNQHTIDFKSYLYKILAYWKLFTVTIIIGFIIANFLNGFKAKRYSLVTTISVKEENNPLFSTGTNIAFNWGGESNALASIKIILGSRTHNEKVIDSLQFYVKYLKDGKYRLEDVYGNVPFNIVVQKNKPQLTSKLIKLEALAKDRVRLSFDFEETKINKLITYTDTESISKSGNLFSEFVSDDLSYSQEFSSNQSINTPFFKLLL